MIKLITTLLFNKLKQKYLYINKLLIYLDVYILIKKFILHLFTFILNSIYEKVYIFKTNGENTQ